MSLPIERVADLCLADAFELGAPCRFHLWLCHPDCPLMPMVALLRAGPSRTPAAQRVEGEKEMLLPNPGKRQRNG
jgi:hypothetical protein